jgi:hypothetical protein
VNTVTTVPGPTPPPPPTSGRPADGIVHTLTGDPDDQVDDVTEDRVYSAVQQGENDPPVDF